MLRLISVLVLVLIASAVVSCETAEETTDGVTAPPAADAAPTPVPEPVVLSGRGQFASQPLTLPGPISVAAFTHNGTANFIVMTFIGGKEDLLINEIGPYTGTRPLASTQPVILDIRADGAWTVNIEAIGSAPSGVFEGRGDAVSGRFSPPSQGAWEMSHTGKANFIVQAHCAGGTNLVQNEIGAVSGSRVISFQRGPCYWEVQADGIWSLKPR